MMEPAQRWDACGVRVTLWPASPRAGTQAWNPPHLQVTYLLSPAIYEPDAVLSVIEMFADAGAALRDVLAVHSSGTLDL